MAYLLLVLRFIKTSQIEMHWVDENGLGWFGLGRAHSWL